MKKEALNWYHSKSFEERRAIMLKYLRHTLFVQGSRNLLDSEIVEIYKNEKL